MPPVLTVAESPVPHLKKSGYGDEQIKRRFNVDEITIPVAAFAGRPFDSWSACIAAVNLNGDSLASGGKKAKKGEKPYDIRKELGIHSTPSVLIHHMLGQCGA